jgi:hypothetical protein
MTRTKEGKERRAKIRFEDLCTFVPDLGEVILIYCGIGNTYHLYTESEWEACGNHGAGSRLTADSKGFIFDNGQPTDKRLPPELMK